MSAAPQVSPDVRRRVVIALAAILERAARERLSPPAPPPAVASR